MKPALSAFLLVSMIACSGAREAGSDASSPFAPSEPPQNAAPVVFEVPSDEMSGILPAGSFADIDALCVAQREMMLPQIEEANGNGVELAARCEASPDVLASARVTLGGDYLEANAITVETGAALAAFLVVRTAEGWTAARSPLLSAAHDDPGCGSIEREQSIAEVRAETGTIVVVTLADREIHHADAEGTLVLTHERVCRRDEWALTCTAPETIAAKVELRDLDADGSL